MAPALLLQMKVSTGKRVCANDVRMLKIPGQSEIRSKRVQENDHGVKPYDRRAGPKSQSKHEVKAICFHAPLDKVVFWGQ